MTCSRKPGSGFRKSTIGWALPLMRQGRQFSAKSPFRLEECKPVRNGHGIAISLALKNPLMTAFHPKRSFGVYFPEAPFCLTFGTGDR